MNLDPFTLELLLKSGPVRANITSGDLVKGPLPAPSRDFQNWFNSLIVAEKKPNVEKIMPVKCVRLTAGRVL